MDYEKIIISIIEAQENIIGPVAVERAKRVHGIELDWPNKIIKLSEAAEKVVDALVNQYKELFGEISVEVCREAAIHSIGSGSVDLLPPSLR